MVLIIYTRILVDYEKDGLFSVGQNKALESCSSDLCVRVSRELLLEKLGKR